MAAPQLRQKSDAPGCGSFPPPHAPLLGDCGEAPSRATACSPHALARSWRGSRAISARFDAKLRKDNIAMRRLTLVPRQAKRTLPLFLLAGARAMPLTILQLTLPQRDAQATQVAPPGRSRLRGRPDRRVPGPQSRRFLSPSCCVRRAHGREQGQTRPRSPRSPPLSTCLTTGACAPTENSQRTPTSRVRRLPGRLLG
jgi:hypothetical protein